jgi:hypothetical protein
MAQIPNFGARAGGFSENSERASPVKRWYSALFEFGTTFAQ